MGEKYIYKIIWSIFRKSPYGFVSKWGVLQEPTTRCHGSEATYSANVSNK